LTKIILEKLTGMGCFDVRCREDHPGDMAKYRTVVIYCSLAVISFFINESSGCYRSEGYGLLEYIPQGLIVVYKHFRQPTASMFYPEAGYSRFL
jgi:hypothetical protein